MDVYSAGTPIASGYAHSCAGLECIGENGSGQLGDGTVASKNVMTPGVTSSVLNGLSVKQVAAGFDFTCWVAGEAESDLWNAIFCAGAAASGAGA
jgi:hypothetical protein